LEEEITLAHAALQSLLILFVEIDGVEDDD
jgi:hypothetical protein